MVHVNKLASISGMVFHRDSTCYR